MINERIIKELSKFIASFDNTTYLFQIGKVYYISRCQLKPANKQFNNVKNDYEMTLTADSEIIPCHEEVTDIPMIQYDFCPISSIEEKNKDTLIGKFNFKKNKNYLLEFL